MSRRRLCAGGQPAALDGAAFAEAMDALGPWDSSPSLAAAVSGGSDSLALALLAQDWTRCRGGRLLALIVDHNLRPGSAAEAEQVRLWLERRKLAAVVLREEDGQAAASGGSLQERARRLRHRLLLEACLQRGIRHLLFAHQVEDQAETVLMRLVRGSGLRGLAGIAPAALAPESAGRVRLLRPLLGMAKARLRAGLEAAEQAWMEDPSNADRRHERVRWRALMPVLEAGGIEAERLAAGARRVAAARHALDRAAAAWLAQAATPSLFGHVELRMDGLARLDAAVAEAVLRHVLGAVGGGAYPPRRERLSALLEALGAEPKALARTLAGCLVRLQKGRLQVLREPAGVRETLVARPGRVLWDGRFELHLAGPSERLKGITISCLGGAGAAELRRSRSRAKAPVARVPASQLATIPALWREGRLLEVPHLPGGEGSLSLGVAWAPRQPLTG